MQLFVPFLVPLVCLWAKHHEAIILRDGFPLTTAQLQIARRLGIRNPERVRLLAVETLPPHHRLLLWACARVGLNPSQTIGLTLRYGIYLSANFQDDRRLLVHELAHVAQYERLGGHLGFFRPYLRECIHPGYPLGPMEQEAKRAETQFARF